MKNALIRKALPEDCAAVALIYNQYLGKSSFDLSVKSSEEFIRFLDHKQERNEELLVLTESDQVIGWGIIKKYSEREAYQFAAETSVYLHPDHLGRGYGTFLKREVMDTSQRMGYQYLVAKVIAKNVKSIEYNLKLGYRICGLQKRIGFINGEWIDIVLMEAHLTGHE